MNYKWFAVYAILFGSTVALLTDRILRPPPRPTAAACFGAYSTENAQRNAERFVRLHPVDPIWTREVILHGTVRCLPLLPSERWAECHVDTHSSDETRYVIDCDAAERNDVGCR